MVPTYCPFQTMREDIVKKGKLPCTHCNGGLNITEVRECLNDFFDYEALPLVCTFVASCAEFRKTQRHGMVGAWLLTLEHSDGDNISTSDATLKAAMRKLGAEGSSQVGKSLHVRVLCSHQGLRRKRMGCTRSC